MPNDVDKNWPAITLYVGSRDGEAFSEDDREAVTQCVSESFGSFTIVDGIGFFEGRPVATLVIKIATDDVATVVDLAIRLGRLLRQRFIGLERNGRFGLYPVARTLAYWVPTRIQDTAR